MKKVQPCLFILAAALLLTGCGSFSGIKGSGVAKTESKELPPFTAVNCSGISTIVLSIGESQSVSATFDDNLLEHLDLSVTNGELKITTNVNFSSQVGPKIEIVVPKINKLSLSGAGSIQASGIEEEGELEISVSGAGKLTADGIVKNLKVTAAGVAKIELEKLLAESVELDMSGAGSATLYAADSINTKISGVGNVTVHGNPKERNDSSKGLGKVTFIE